MHNTYCVSYGHAPPTDTGRVPRPRGGDPMCCGWEKGVHWQREEARSGENNNGIHMVMYNGENTSP